MACKWLHAMFHGGKGHAAPASLMPYLIQDMTRRNHPVMPLDGRPTRPLSKYVFERGGACRFDRPKETFDFEGLRALVIPSEEIAYRLDRLQESPIRTFEPLPRGRSIPQYYKLHGDLHCLVLSVYQKTLLEMMLRERLPIAEATATAFYAHHKTALEAAATIPACIVDGPDPVARFRPRLRGEA